MMEQEQRNLIPKSVAVAAVLSGRAEAMHRGQTYPVQLRMPIYTLAKVDALVAQSGKSRSGVINMLTEVALEAVLEQMPLDIAEQLVQFEAQALGKLSGELEGKKQSAAEQEVY